MPDPLMPGAMVIAYFPQHQPPDHEQEGLRPAIVMGLPGRVGQPRYPVVFLFPLTTDRRQVWAVQNPAIYPLLVAGSGGIPRNSFVLLDQIRALGLSRIVRMVGTLPPDVYSAIHVALLHMLGDPPDLTTTVM